MVAAALLACARAAAPQARSVSTGPGSFAGKTALVTGAASGIGLRCAQRLAERGARVVGDNYLASSGVAVMALYFTIQIMIAFQDRVSDLPVYSGLANPPAGQV